jgi:hypothetical protein
MFMHLHAVSSKTLFLYTMSSVPPTVYLSVVADPGSGAFLTPGSGMKKNPDPG